MSIVDPASAFIGTLGRLIPVYSNPTMGYEPGLSKRSFQTTLEGKVKAQIQPIGRRTWTLNAQLATGPELATLIGFATGEWGNGPFVWVSPAASRVNLLAPGVASCGPEAPQHAVVTVSGPMLLPDGSWAGRSLASSNVAIQMWFGPSSIPVVPGMTVTGSAYVLGAAAQMTIQFMDAAGLAIATINGPASGEAGVVKRLSVTALVPALAVAARLVARSTKQAARPAFTWTDRVFEWGSGQGCGKAIVETVAAVALKSSTATTGRRDSNSTFTIREVG